MKKRGRRILTFFLVVLIFGGIIGTTASPVVKNINLGLDLQGGFEVLFEVEPVDKDQEVDRTLMEAAVRRLNDRVNRLGISEASIDIEGEDRIRVQLAGVEDPQEAREMLATSARLSFRDVHDVELMDGSNIKEGSAKQDFHPTKNTPIVTLQLKDAEIFHEITTELAAKYDPTVPIYESENLLVIWMDYQEGDSFKEEVFKDDPKYVSAPQVSEPLSQPEIMIEGNFTVESAQYLADILNAGSLPVHMDELYSTTVGAQFGEQALKQTVLAGTIGVSIIILFVIGVYRFPGVIATVNLLIYIYLIILVFGLMNGVLTLPGIAALILGVSMAVDANILTFERIKEELRLGKSVKASFKAGTKNALSSIMDANITTLIAAVALFIFGTSAVKGFATLLIISVIISLLTSVYGTRQLLKLWVQSGFLDKRKSWFGIKEKDIKDIRDISATEEEPTLFNRHINFVKPRKVSFVISALIVAVGAVSLLVLKLNPGVDFTSGSRVEVIADQSLSTEQIEADLAELDLEAKTIVISGNDNDSAVMRYDFVLTEEKEDEINRYFIEKYGHEPLISVVSPIVGQELVKNAIYALAIALIGMIIYVTIRFEFYFAITTIITLLFDSFFMLFIFSITRLEFDVTIIAALLTIVGYSINNVIVVFDRLRENIRREKVVRSFSQLAKIINRSLVQTFTRSMNVTITTLIAVLAFMLFGAQSIFGFSVALLAGLSAGLFSSIFLASQLWLIWRGKLLKEKPLDFRKRKRVDGPQV